jgi:hypothetical protein
MEIQPSNAQRVYWTHIFSPSVINEFRTGMERIHDFQTADSNTPFSTTYAGQFKGNGLDFMRAMGFSWLPSVDPTVATSLPLINIGGQNWQTGTNFGYQTGFNFRGGYDYRVETHHYTDAFSWIRGAHSF